VEIVVRNGCTLIGETLISLGKKLRTKVLVCAVQREDEVIIPSGNFMIKEGDRIHFTTDASALRDFLSEINLVTMTLRNIMIIGGNKTSFYLADELSKKRFHIKLIASDKAIAEELAELLHGAVGASRVAVDKGWISHSHLIGQSGITVTPDLYINCGISGSVQHIVGMRDSKCVVSINKDPKALIFNVSDYGIVGDLHKVLPALIAEIRRHKG
jgi:hypothetical protein